MILYRPIDGDVNVAKIVYRPKTCFTMTQLGDPIPENIIKIRVHLNRIFQRHNINIIDANTVVTGRDFLMKIWNMLLSVPLGVAIIDKDMTQQTFANIFYEVGMLQAYGKETLVIKTKDTKVPSDFVRTEYIEFNDDFEQRVNKFIKSFFEQAEHYEMMADLVENNPLLAIDHLRRAYLISGDDNMRVKAQKIFDSAALEDRARNSVEELLKNF
jgi:hypothetical protein